MQRYLLILLTVIGLSACKNQPTATGDQSSSNFQADFAKRYPNAQDVIWDTLDIGFAALFTAGEFENKAFFDTKGVYRYTSTFIEQTALPEAVRKVLNTTYQNAAAAVIMRIETAGKRTYQIELETSTDYISLEFDESGKLLKEQKAPLSNEEIQRQEEEGVEQNDK